MSSWTSGTVVILCILYVVAGLWVARHVHQYVFKRCQRNGLCHFIFYIRIKMWQIYFWRGFCTFIVNTSHVWYSHSYMDYILRGVWCLSVSYSFTRVTRHSSSIRNCLHLHKFITSAGVLYLGNLVQNLSAVTSAWLDLTKYCGQTVRFREKKKKKTTLLQPWNRRIKLLSWDEINYRQGFKNRFVNPFLAAPCRAVMKARMHEAKGYSRDLCRIAAVA